MGYSVKQSSTTVNLVFGPVVLSTDHISAATGKTLTVTISKNGAAFASPSGAITETGDGNYYIAANATDNNTLGALKVNASCTGCDPYDETFLVVPYDPFDAVHLGLSALPNVAAGAAGGLATATNSSGQVTASSIAGVTFPSTVPSLAAIESGLPSDASITTDVETALTAQGYTSTLATNIGTTNTTVATNLDTALSGVATNASTAATQSTAGAASAATAATQATSAATSAATAVTQTTATAIANAVMDQANGVETGITLRNLARALESFALGNVTVSGNTVTFLRKDGTTTAWTITTDTSGNRTSSTPGTL